MKTSNKILLTALIVIVLLIIGFMIFLRANVSLESVGGSGNIVSLERETDFFTGLKFRGNMEVFLTQDSITSLVVEADDNLHEFLKTRKENGTLYVYLEESIGRGATMRVHVSFPELELLEISAGVTATASEALSGDYFKHKAQAGAKTALNLQYSEVDMVLQAGAMATLSGNAGTMNLVSAAGVMLNARDLYINDCEIKANAGSVNYLNVSRSLSGSVGQGAIVYYSGNPVIEGLSTRRGGHIEAAAD